MDPRIAKEESRDKEQRPTVMKNETYHTSKQTKKRNKTFQLNHAGQGCKAARQATQQSMDMGTFLYASESMLAVTLVASVPRLSRTMIASMVFLQEKMRSYVVVSAQASVVLFTPASWYGEVPCVECCILISWRGKVAYIFSIVYTNKQGVIRLPPVGGDACVSIANGREIQSFWLDFFY